jgi:hypothetical protein
MDEEDVGALLGCLFFAGIILFKIAIFVAVVYIAWHFISKFW